MTNKERFMSRIEMIPFHECWEWTGEINSTNGYGRFRENSHEIFYAHRYSYELHFGKIPKGHYVCHKCDNRKCVNPKHLFVGTATDNNHDMFKKGRNPLKMLTDEEKKQILVLKKEGLSGRKIAEKLGRTHRTINDFIKKDALHYQFHQPRR